MLHHFQNVFNIIFTNPSKCRQRKSQYCPNKYPPRFPHLISSRVNRCVNITAGRVGRCGVGSRSPSQEPLDTPAATLFLTPLGTPQTPRTGVSISLETPGSFRRPQGRGGPPRPYWSPSALLGPTAGQKFAVQKCLIFLGGWLSTRPSI